MRFRKRRLGDSASPDLTPMIDVTFMLLIFFLLCTRFVSAENGLDTRLPDTSGPSSDVSVPAEELTIYCHWNPEARGCSYSLGIGGRSRVAVGDAYATLADVLPSPRETAQAAVQRRANYARVFDALVASLEEYERGAGANVESYQISFARDASRGAASGTAPWAFVTLAIDATARRNELRKRAGTDLLPVNFKFTDSLGRYPD